MNALKHCGWYGWLNLKLFFCFLLAICLLLMITTENTPTRKLSSFEKISPKVHSRDLYARDMQDDRREIESKTCDYPGGLPLPYFHSHMPNAYLHPTNDTIYQDSIIGFVHNPKSAGSTIKSCMMTMLRTSKADPPVLMSFKTAANIRQDLLNGLADHEKYYMGDSTLGICDYGTSQPCSYFTMLREPYHRVISHYYFCKDGGRSWPQCNNTLEEFVLESCSLFFRQHTVRFNCQQEMVNNAENCHGNVTCNVLPWLCNATEVHVDNLGMTYEQRRQVLEYVVDNLDQTFGVIGLTEEFETSLKLFQDVYGLPFYDQCKGIHHNSGAYTYREERNRTTEEEIEYAKERLRKNPDVRRCLADDLRIYRKAREIFQLQKQKYESKLKRNKERG